MNDRLILTPQEFHENLNGSASQRKLAHLHAALEAAGAQNILLSGMGQQLQQENGKLKLLLAALLETCGGKAALQVPRLDTFSKRPYRVEMAQDVTHLRLTLVPPEQVNLEELDATRAAAPAEN